MGIFESQIEKQVLPTGTVMTLIFSGNLDESTNLPEVDLNGVRRLVLNVGQIEGVNSIGIRSWMDWMKEIPRASLEIEFVDVQPSFVFQFNMISGFFPKHASVRSLFIPVYCDKCDKQTKTKIDFNEAVKVMNAQSISHEQMIRDHCQDEFCKMEPDYQLKQYLAFIAR